MNYRNRPRKRLAVAALLVAVVCGIWMPALSAAPSCTEQTGNPPPSSSNGGIGGTGAVADGGIGGTGVVAEGGIGGTGIVGTITGFASVCVNGLEVHYDQATPVTRNGLSADAATLAIGQVVVIDAAHAEKGLIAQRIDMLNALEGPVTGIRPESGIIQVMGQTVRVDGLTRLSGLNTLADARPGMSLRVAGFRDANGEVYATRVEAATGLVDASAIGVLVRHATGETNLDGMAVHSASPLPAAGEVLLRGHWDGHQLVVQEAHPDPSLPFIGHAGHVVAEGLIMQRMGATHLRIGGFEVELSAAPSITGITDGTFAEGQRIRVTGRLEGRNRIIAQRIEIERSPRHQHQVSAPAQHNNDAGCEGCQPTERTRLMERADIQRPQRMERLERIPIQRMDMPAGAGMPGMRK